MPASMLTKLRADNYDALRGSRGITGNLTLYKTTPLSGHILLATISEGWFAERERDSAMDIEFLAIRLEITDANDEVLTDDVNGYLSALGIMGRLFVIQSRVAPFGDPSEWVYRCDPTGEAI